MAAPGCPSQNPKQTYVGALGLTTLSNEQSLHDLIIELDGLLGSLKATLGEGDVTTFHILNKTILEEDIADGVLTQNLFAPGVIPSGLSNVQSALPVGAILPYAGHGAPNGWLLCDGASYDAVNHPVLSALLGTGSSNMYDQTVAEGSFRVPDLRGRVPVGQGQGSGLINRSIGSRGGEESHQLTISEMPNHRHRVDFWEDIDPGIIPRAPTVGSHANWITGYRPRQTSFEGGDAAHNNMQPFLVVNYIIKDDPPAPGDTSILYPSEGQTDVSQTVTIIWEQATNADSYELQISSVSGDYGSPVYSASPSKTQQAVPAATLSGTTTYYVRVRGVNTTGNGEWSPEVSFTTIA